MNQTPNDANIISTEWKRNDWDMSKVACSETESVKGSVVVSKGKIAFKYLCVGKTIEFEFSATTIIVENRMIIENKTNAPFRFFRVLFFCTIITITRINVDKINDKPAKLKINPDTSLSNRKPEKITDVVKRGIIFNKKLWSFLTNGRRQKSITIGIKKNRFPPHADNPMVVRIPPSNTLI